VVLRWLESEADEMWSFVQKKAHKPWIWIAIDAQTRQIIALHVGDRSRDSAQELWSKIPLVYREQAIFHLAKAAALPVSHYPSAMHLVPVNVLLVDPNGQVAPGAINGTGLVSCSISN
jgi:hypothetical protein